MNANIVTPRWGVLSCWTIHTFSTIHDRFGFGQIRSLLFFKGSPCNFRVSPPQSNQILQSLSVRASDLYSQLLYQQETLDMAVILPLPLKIEVLQRQWDAEIDFLQRQELLKITRLF